MDNVKESIIIKKIAATGQIIFNDPKRHNAISLAMWDKLKNALMSFAQDSEVRSIVFLGAGDKAFVSGANISEFEQLRTKSDDVQLYEEIVEEVQLMILNYPKPTIAKIRGYCLGVGMGIALCCDIRIASVTGIFAIPAARLGIGYRLSAVANIIRQAGTATALDILLSARRFTAKEALDRGLVHYVIADDQLDQFVNQYISEVNQNAPMTLTLAKEMINALTQTSQHIDNAYFAGRVRECYESNDHREGKTAFKEKRPPRFVGN